MEATKIIQQHSSLNYPEDMATVSKPLQKLGITYFGHALLNPKGEVGGLSSDPNYLTHYLENNMFALDLHTEMSHGKKRFIHWDIVPRQKDGEYYHQTNLDFNLHHIFTLIRPSEAGMNFYHFATNKHNDLMNSFYIENMDLLEQFITSYQDHLLLNSRMRRGLDLKMPMPIIVPTEKINLDNPRVSPDFREAFCDELYSGKLNTIDFSNIRLSHRERQCAHYLLQGLTSKEISHQLNISARTVEVYFDRLKSRFGARNKIQLAAMLVMFASTCGQNKLSA